MAVQQVWIEDGCNGCGLCGRYEDECCQLTLSFVHRKDQYKRATA